MLEDDDSWSARLRRLIRRMLSRCSVWSRIVGCSFLFRTVKPLLAITTTDVSARCAPSRGCVFMYFNLILFVVVVIQWCNDSDSSDKNPAYTHGSLLQVPTTPLSVSATADDVDLVVAVDQIRLQNIWHTTLYYPMLLLHSKADTPLVRGFSPLPPLLSSSHTHSLTETDWLTKSSSQRFAPSREENVFFQKRNTVSQFSVSFTDPSGIRVIVIV